MWPVRLRLIALIPAFIFFLALSSTATGQSTPSGQNQNPSTPAPSYFVPDFFLPDKVSLCGERFPLEVEDVYERLDYEFILAVHGRAQVTLWLKRAGRYFPYIEQRLAQEGLPLDLKYLAVAESDLRPHAYSPARALGTWQFISETGRRYGLRKDRYFDQRLNFEQSTEAAIQYLKKLYLDFGSWLLAMAAYNCGEGCVSKAIQEQQVKNYFYLNLPTETERYVYRIAAIKLILDNPQKYGYSVSSRHIYSPLVRDRIKVSLGREVHFTEAAQAIGTYYKVLKELNPEIKGKYLPKGEYFIYVPNGLGPKMSAWLSRIPVAEPPKPEPKPQKAASEKSPSKKGADHHVVKRGDTLLGISRATGVSVDTLKKLNNIKGSNIRIGQKLRLK